MNIECKEYKNILDLYNTQADFKLSIDNDGSLVCGTFEDYMDDYSDKSDIVDRVLCDALYNTNYDWKLSRHRLYKNNDWRDIKIIIFLKKIKSNK